MSTTSLAQLPIGIFDSGMGGLTVLRALTQQLPDESFIYLGDTARLPYGTKSQDTVVRYAAQITNMLLHYQVKCVVVACNTATAAALPYLQQTFPQLLITGVIEPSAKKAVQATQSNQIAVLATETTIQQASYQTTIQALNPRVQIITRACSVFVSLAEEGWHQNDVSLAAARLYLLPLLADFPNIDQVILGCTHFPVLIPLLTSMLPKSVQIVDSATAMANTLTQLLQERQLSAPPASHPTTGHTTFLVTDSPQRFARIGQFFYGQTIPLSTIELIDLQ
ncbi:MAG: glutamate racemase [Legionellales bacterium]|nr:glutamate racemase [Legionellales bacterium]